MSDNLRYFRRVFSIFVVLTIATIIFIVINYKFKVKKDKNNNVSIVNFQKQEKLKIDNTKDIKIENMIDIEKNKNFSQNLIENKITNQDILTEETEQLEQKEQLEQIEQNKNNTLNQNYEINKEQIKIENNEEENKKELLIIQNLMKKFCSRDENNLDFSNELKTNILCKINLEDNLEKFSFKRITEKKIKDKANIIIYSKIEFMKFVQNISNKIEELKKQTNQNITEQIIESEKKINQININEKKTIQKEVKNRSKINKEKTVQKELKNNNKINEDKSSNENDKKENDKKENDKKEIENDKSESFQSQKQIIVKSLQMNSISFFEKFILLLKKIFFFLRNIEIKILEKF